VLDVVEKQHILRDDQVRVIGGASGTRDSKECKEDDSRMSIGRTRVKMQTMKPVLVTDWRAVAVVKRVAWGRWVAAEQSAE
jgi:hypothetical protein